MRSSRSNDGVTAVDGSGAASLAALVGAVVGAASVAGDWLAAVSSLGSPLGVLPPQAPSRSAPASIAAVRPVRRVVVMAGLPLERSNGPSARRGPMMVAVAGCGKRTIVPLSRSAAQPLIRS